jgi:hypothetical protein
VSSIENDLVKHFEVRKRERHNECSEWTAQLAKIHLDPPIPYDEYYDTVRQRKKVNDILIAMGQPGLITPPLLRRTNL